MLWREQIGFLLYVFIQDEALRQRINDSMSQLQRIKNTTGTINQTVTEANSNFKEQAILARHGYAWVFESALESTTPVSCVAAAYGGYVNVINSQLTCGLDTACSSSAAECPDFAHGCAYAGGTVQVSGPVMEGTLLHLHRIDCANKYSQTISLLGCTPGTVQRRGDHLVLVVRV